ncbi:hypothetical protein AAII07_45700 [Microvirga sp. 0TCS3.31]
MIEHIGQVLRNRLRDDLLVLVPGEMLDRLKGVRPVQGVVAARVEPKLDGSNPLGPDVPQRISFPGPEATLRPSWF